MFSRPVRSRAASDLAWRMRSAEMLGIEAVEPRIDGQAFMGRVLGVVAELAQRSAAAIGMSKQIDLVRGHGRLMDAHTVAVDTPEGEKRISARAVVIATGSSPIRPGFLPWESPRLMTTDQAVTASDLPASIIVMGGGVIGCEMATVYSELGIATTVIEMLDSLLGGLDAEAGKAVTASLTERGVEVLTGQKVTAMTDDGESIVVTLDDRRGTQAEH